MGRTACCRLVSIFIGRVLPDIQRANRLTCGIRYTQRDAQSSTGDLRCEQSSKPGDRPRKIHCLIEALNGGGLLLVDEKGSGNLMKGM
jgi:hypothetical protein